MSITSTTEIGRRAATTDQNNQRTYTKVYRVESDIQNESEAAVRDSVPWFLGQVHDTDPTAFALSASASQESDDNHSWRVTVEFGSWPEGSTNPLLQPSLESWGVQQSTVAIERDRDGKAIVNSAEIPYLDPVEVIVGLPVLTITKNQPASFNPAFGYTFIEKTNSNSFKGAPAGTVKVLSISSDEQTDPVIGQYWVVRYQFLFKFKGFKLRILDAGLRE
jgi:hypothetical protein